MSPLEIQLFLSCFLFPVKDFNSLDHHSHRIRLHLVVVGEEVVPSCLGVGASCPWVVEVQEGLSFLGDGDPYRVGVASCRVEGLSYQMEVEVPVEVGLSPTLGVVASCLGVVPYQVVEVRPCWTAGNWVGQVDTCPSVERMLGSWAELEVAASLVALEAYPVTCFPWSSAQILVVGGVPFLVA